MSCPPPLPSEDLSVLQDMIAGRPYHYADPYIQRVAGLSQAKLAAIHAERDPERRQVLLHDYFVCTRPENKIGFGGNLFCEYGFNVTLGDDVAIGPGCYFLDVGPISLGDRTMLGPSVSIYTPVHPLMPEARNGTKGKEAAKAIAIGSDCWIGGGATICPGVTIGDGSTIGAGSVVTKDIPPRSVAVGNPARVIKTIPAATEEDLAPWR